MDINLYRSIDRILKPIRSKISGMIQKGVIHQEDKGIMQVSLGDGDSQDGIQYMQHFGLYSRPPSGSETLILFPGGLRQVGFAISSTPQNSSPVKLESGETVLYASGDEASSIALRKSGAIEIRNKDHELVDLVCALAEKVNFLAEKIGEMKVHLIGTAQDSQGGAVTNIPPTIDTTQAAPTLSTIISNLNSFKGSANARS